MDHMRIRGKSNSIKKGPEGPFKKTLCPHSSADPVPIAIPLRYQNILQHTVAVADGFRFHAQGAEHGLVEVAPGCVLRAGQVLAGLEDAAP